MSVVSYTQWLGNTRYDVADKEFSLLYNHCIHSVTCIIVTFADNGGKGFVNFNLDSFRPNTWILFRTFPWGILEKVLV